MVAKGGITRSRVENWQRLDFFSSFRFSLSTRFVGVLYSEDIRNQEETCQFLFQLCRQSRGRALRAAPWERARKSAFPASSTPYSLRCRDAAPRVRPEPSFGRRASFQGATTRDGWLSSSRHNHPCSITPRCIHMPTTSPLPAGRQDEVWYMYLGIQHIGIPRDGTEPPRRTRPSSTPHSISITPRSCNATPQFHLPWRCPARC